MRCGRCAGEITGGEVAHLVDRRPEDGPPPSVLHIRLITCGTCLAPSEEGFYEGNLRERKPRMPERLTPLQVSVLIGTMQGAVYRVPSKVRIRQGASPHRADHAVTSAAYELLKWELLKWEPAHGPRRYDYEPTAWAVLTEAGVETLRRHLLGALSTPSSP